MAQHDVPLMPPTSGKKLDMFGARWLRTHAPEVLDDGVPLNIERAIDVTLAGEYGIDVVLGPLPEGVHGLTEPPNRLTLPEEVYLGLRDAPRARFTGAHELVHAVMHLPHLTQPFVSRGGNKLYRRAEVPTPNDPEWQANRGAAALLMPAQIVLALIRDNPFDPITAIMERFLVSSQSATYRYNDAMTGRLWLGRV